jgi:signal transduction histidine kinase
MQPFDRLNAQLGEAAISDFGFRIKNFENEQNEASVLADAINQLLEKIQKLGENQKRFISYASHELRTPLTITKGVLQTSLAYDQSEEAQKNSIQEALLQVNRAIDLSNNLLYLTEVESISSPIFMHSINILELVMDTIDVINQKYPKQFLNFKIDDSFTESEEGELVNGLFHLLRSALINVLDNACKYSNKKPIEVTLSKDDTFIKIEFRDQGIGISREDIQNVFLPMMRGKNSTHIQGSGIGLTLVKKIIELHKGKFDIQSEINQGTCVCILLPIA